MSKYDEVPCYECYRSDKQIGCHSMCQAYTKYKLKKTLLSRNKKEDLEKWDIFYESVGRAYSNR